MLFNETNRARHNRARRSRLLFCGLLATLVASIGITWSTSHMNHPVAIRTVNAVAVNPLQELYDHSVYMAGDSITWMTAPYFQFLCDIANPTRVCQIDAFPGVTLPQVLAARWFQNKRNAPPMPPLAVVALGGNDSDAEVQSGMFPWYVWEAIETLINPQPNSPPVQHIYWINFYSQNPTYPGNNAANNVVKNQQLVWAASFFPQQVTVLDWASYIAQHPEWMLWDGVHYNPDGCAARAVWIAEHIPA
jgi:lysophospholipase L1-like esterase